MAVLVEGVADGHCIGRIDLHPGDVAADGLDQFQRVQVLRLAEASGMASVVPRRLERGGQPVARHGVVGTERLDQPLQDRNGLPCPPFQDVGLGGRQRLGGIEGGREGVAGHGQGLEARESGPVQGRRQILAGPLTMSTGEPYCGTHPRARRWDSSDPGLASRKAARASSRSTHGAAIPRPRA